MKPPFLRISAAVLLATQALLAGGCATPTRRPAVPLKFQTSAEVAGFPPGLRYFPRDEEDVKLFEKDFVESWTASEPTSRLPGAVGTSPARGVPRHLGRR